MAELRELVGHLPIQGGNDGPGLKLQIPVPLRRGKGHGEVAEPAGDLLEFPDPDRPDQRGWRAPPG